MANPPTKGERARPVPIEFPDAIIATPIIYGEWVPLVMPIGRSGRWKFNRLTNRRMRKCLASSPRFRWLRRQMMARLERWNSAQTSESKPEGM